jgi:hypothetical protein
MKDAALFTNEADFRRWFEQNLSRFGIREIVLSQEVCPDYVVIMEDGRVAKVEAELFAVNFKYHGHDPRKADYIVACYSKTTEIEGVPVLAAHRLWFFDVDTTDLLSPAAPLSEDEALLLSGIHQSGGISVSALSQGELAGNNELWMRVHPEKIAAIPRGRIDDNLMNILTQPAKEWLRKYHHLLVGAGISDEGCILLESLARRQLIRYRPIEIIAAMYDGVFSKHPAWFPMEAYATPEAWQYHKDSILKYLYGRRRREDHTAA